MSRYLMMDIGAGTLDVLYYDDQSGVHYKAVVKSPVLLVAEKAASMPGNLLVVGNEMGGGSLSAVLKQRAEKAEVVMSASAAMTVHHDPERVRSWGIRIVEDSEAEGLKKQGKHALLSVSDLEEERLKRIVTGFGVPFAFDVVGICAQDHGMPPQGVSHLDYRHTIFKAGLDENPFPHALLYRRDEVPATFNRLRSIAEGSRMLPTKEVYVMDSGMAAILGASMDPQASRKESVLVLDIATSHTVGAALDQGEIAGFFEYHTHDITLHRLEALMQKLADGQLDHRKVLQEGGHGAYIRKNIGYDSVEIIVATGPKRKLVQGSQLPIVFGAPLGDNMMTGTVGLLEAVRRRKGLEPVTYV